MKENTGKARAEQYRRQAMTNAAVLAFLVIIFYSAVHASDKAKARPGEFAIRHRKISVPKFKTADGSELPLEFQESHRRKLYRTWWANHGGKSDRELILSGEATLVDLAIQQKNDGRGGYDATGTFCHVDFYLHKADPTVVPMFRDLVAKSIHCSGEGKIRVDLQSIVDEARAIDAREDTATRSMEPAGFVFHESRCGSTLVANSLMAMEPDANRVYSESPPPVTAAKMLLQNSEAMVAIDMPAGPSEVLVIADRDAPLSHVAIDLLSQAEHGPDSQAILIALPGVDVEGLKKEVEYQCSLLPRAEVTKKALSHSRIISVRDVQEAVRISNLYAPEHLIVNIEDAESILDSLDNAGSVFLGRWTPESVGDYASGTNHVLPTYGYARMYSGVSLDAFTKKMTVQRLTKEGLERLGPSVAKMAEVEGLDAHRRAVTLRLGMES